MITAVYDILMDKCLSLTLLIFYFVDFLMINRSYIPLFCIKIELWFYGSNIDHNCAFDHRTNIFTSVVNC